MSIGAVRPSQRLPLTAHCVRVKIVIYPRGYCARPCVCERLHMHEAHTFIETSLTRNLLEMSNRIHK